MRSATTVARSARIFIPVGRPHLEALRDTPDLLSLYILLSDRCDKARFYQSIVVRLVKAGLIAAIGQQDVQTQKVRCIAKRFQVRTANGYEDARRPSHGRGAPHSASEAPSLLPPVPGRSS